MQTRFNSSNSSQYNKYNIAKKSEKPAFTGVHEEAAEAVLKFTAHKFRSPSLLRLLVHKRNGQQKSQPFLRVEAIKSNNILCYYLRPKYACYNNDTSFTLEHYINTMKDSIETQRKIDGRVYVNCGELAALTQYELLKRGIEAHEVLIKLFKKTIAFNEIPCTRHCAVITGLNKHADIKNPQTWGENAKVIDLWKKHHVILPATEWLTKILRFIRFNPNENYFELSITNSKPANNAIYTLQQKQNLDRLFLQYNSP